VGESVGGVVDMSVPREERLEWMQDKDGKKMGAAIRGESERGDVVDEYGKCPWFGGRHQGMIGWFGGVVQEGLSTAT